MDRSGVTTETSEPFVPVMRRLMAEFQDAVRPGPAALHRRGVGFIGYDASIGFEPAGRSLEEGGVVCGEAGSGSGKPEARSTEGEDDVVVHAVRSVLAFDHVQHRNPDSSPTRA